MNNSIQTDKIYLNAMLEVIRWVSNLDQYYRNAVVTKLASNVHLIIGELERVVSLRKATVGERKKPAIQRYRKPVSQWSGEGFSSRTREARIAQEALRNYDLINKRLFRKTEHSTKTLAKNVCCLFLVACTRLYKSLRRSVCRSVCLSVGLSVRNAFVKSGEANYLQPKKYGKTHLICLMCASASLWQDMSVGWSVRSF